MRSDTWRVEGLCAIYPEPFFDDTAQYKVAKELCPVCPVLEDCAEWIDTVDFEVAGYVAGTTKAQRHRALQERRLVASTCLSCGELFKPRTGHQRLCSTACRKARHNAIKTASYQMVGKYPVAG